MSFASAIIGRNFSGPKARTFGTFTNAGGDTGGNIDTGLRMCESIKLTHTGAAVVASAPSVNETLPVAGNAITIVTVDGADGLWEAIGDMHN
jgi:hypothetical protein